MAISKQAAKTLSANEQLLAALDRQAAKVEKLQATIIRNRRSGKLTAAQTERALIKLSQTIISSPAIHQMIARLVTTTTPGAVPTILSDVAKQQLIRKTHGLIKYRAYQAAYNGGNPSMGTAAKDAILEAVREQVVQANPNTVRWIRLANAGACDFCQELSGTTVAADAMELHRGCGCVIVPAS